MNPDANQNAVNSPKPAGADPAHLAPARAAIPPAAPPAGGLKSTLKVAVPLAALVGVVFGITYLAQYTPPKDDPKGDKGPKGGPSGEPPLRFFTSARQWDPPKLFDPTLRPEQGYRHLPLLAPSAIAPASEDPFKFNFTLADRLFQGFYEPGEQPRATPFWFENRNQSPVTMQLKGVSCSACTGGRLAAIPPATARVLLQHSVVAALPVGAFQPFGVGLSQPAAALFGMTSPQGELTPLQWTQYQFANPAEVKFHVPAAGPNADGWSPQWGILELTFRVSAKPGEPIKPLRAGFATQVDNTPQQIAANEFVITFDSGNPCELSRPVIDVGKFDPLSGDREYELILYSNTRGPGSEFGDLAPPVAIVQAPVGIVDPVKFVEVTKVARIPDAELTGVTERLATESQRLSHVRAAYRVTVVVRPKVGETRLDLGALERTVSFTSGGATPRLAIRGTVRGAVWLDSERTDVEVKSFPGARGHTESIALTTEKPGVELAVVKDECKPPEFTYVLEKQPDAGGQGHYRLKLTIPPGQVYGGFKGDIVLEVKGPTPQRIRIPFRGQANL